MRRGGGAAKGSAFERRLCVDLSLWISHGARADLFARNVLSGGRFTIAMRTGTELGQPGDMIGIHPLALPFIASFMVEAKHWRTLYLDAFLLRSASASPLGKVYNDASKSAKSAGRHALVIAKQNNYPAIVLCSPFVLKCARQAASALRQQALLPHHVMFADDVGICVLMLETMISRVRVDKFLEYIKGGTIEQREP